jgi:hypothetical protein
VTASPEVLQDSTLVLERRKSERNNKRNKQIYKAIKNKQVTEQGICGASSDFLLTSHAQLIVVLLS